MRHDTGPKFSWLEFLKALYQKVFDTDIFSHSAQVAFYFSFALFPLLYFLVSLSGLVLGTSTRLQSELFQYLRQIMPTSVFVLVTRTIDEIIQNSTGGKATLGLLIALWSASAGFDAIRTAMNAVYSLKEHRAWWRIKVESIVLTFVVAVLVGALLALVFYGWQIFQAAIKLVGFEVTSPSVLITIQWVAILLATLLACEVIYNLLPAFKKRKWIWITPGSIVAILVWILLTAGFRTYLGFFNTYDRTYGSLGAVIIMMLWLYLTASALMIGGAINAVLRELRGRDPDPTTSA